MYFGYREPEPWRDTMQVCMNGHVINAGYKKYPEFNKDFCIKCGAKTIINCPSCETPIPGDMQAGRGQRRHRVPLSADAGPCGT